MRKDINMTRESRARHQHRLQPEIQEMHSSEMRFHVHRF